MRFLSIQSSVAYGHVGNSAAVFPLQRLGLCIEHLVSILVICHHAALQDASQQAVAAVQAQLLRDRYRAVRLLSGLSEMQHLREQVGRVGDDIENNQSSMLNEIEPEPFSHSWFEETGVAVKSSAEEGS